MKLVRLFVLVSTLAASSQISAQSVTALGRTVIITEAQTRKPLIFKWEDLLCLWLPWTCETRPTDPDPDPDPDLGYELPPFFEITDVQHAGSGCSVGEDAVEYQDDGVTFILSPSDLIAEKGDGVPLREARKNCQVLISIEHTPGWSYALETVAAPVSGFVARDSAAEFKVSTYVQGEAETGMIDEVVSEAGSFADDLSFALEEEAKWTPCDGGRALNVNVAMRIVGDAGLIALDDSAEIKLKWRACDTGSGNTASGGTASGLSARNR